MSGRKCDACGGPIRKESRAKYCSLPCRTRGRRFNIAYSKSGLVLNMLKNRMECEALDDKITKMKKESMDETKKLGEVGRISDAFNTLIEWRNNLVRLDGKRQGLHRKTCDLYDTHLDLRRRYGMYDENGKRGAAT